MNFYLALGDRRKKAYSTHIPLNIVSPQPSILLRSCCRDCGSPSRAERSTGDSQSE